MSQSSENGASAEPPRAEPAEHRDAEQVAEEWAERIGRWLLPGAARAKEEAEDIWAEAQEVRRNL
jgi:hypothetical protein